MALVQVYDETYPSTNFTFEVADGAGGGSGHGASGVNAPLSALWVSSPADGSGLKLGALVSAGHPNGSLVVKVRIRVRFLFLFVHGH
jgi:hypothetical protein